MGVENMSNQHQAQTNYENNIIIEFKKNTEPVCYYCKKFIQINGNKNDLTVDHKTPLSRGGKSIQSNLAIACSKCNQEKANMTEKEYKKFKANQKRLLNSYDAVKLSNAAIELFDKIIDQAQKVNIQYNQAEKDLQKQEKKIASKNHTASSSFQIINNLKNAINQRDSLKLQRDTLNILHGLIVPMKKQIESMKIVDTILQEKYSTLKASCIDKNSENKVVQISDSQEELAQ